MAHQVLFHMSPWIADLTCFHDRGSVAEHGSLGTSNGEDHIGPVKCIRHVSVVAMTGR
jgi:hypothetical protein